MAGRLSISIEPVSRLPHVSETGGLGRVRVAIVDADDAATGAIGTSGVRVPIRYSGADMCSSLGCLNRNKPVRNEPGVLVYSAADVTARLLADYGVTEASLR
jgi:hypothetical protein